MLLAVSISANILIAAGIIILFVLLRREREVRKQRGLFGAWPIRKVAPEDFDPVFASGPLGPGRQTEIRSIGAYRVAGGIGDFETWIICNLAKSAELIFEFGTCTGKTTYLLAANAPTATVVTLTLRPEDVASYQEVSGDDFAAFQAAQSESGFDTFFYNGTKEEEHIIQLFGDSKKFDESRFGAKADLVFVDGAHARSYVESDSQKALNMIKSGGIVLWHDYRGPRRASGVFEALNSLATQIDLVHIAGTSFVAYRAPLNPVRPYSA